MAIRIFAVRTSEPGALLTPSAAELPALVSDPEVVLWVDIDAPGPETQKILSDVFGLHPLLIEDAFADAPTPKVEDLEDYLYVILHGLTDREPTSGEIDTADLDFFLGKSWLITYYRYPFAALEHTRKAVERDPALLARGPAVVAHRVMDRMIDEFLPLMEKLDAEIDGIEAAIVRRPDAALLERIFRIKHSLQRIRRIGLHQRQLLGRLARGDFALVPEEVQPFFSDVYDHFVKVTDLNDVYRELMGSSMEAYLGIQSHRLNEVMRMLTIFSTVMLPLNFIAGVYGMNFDYMPGLHWQYGYETALGVMTLIGVLMILFFKSRRWV